MARSNKLFSIRRRVRSLNFNSQLGEVHSEVFDKNYIGFGIFDSILLLIICNIIIMLINIGNNINY